MEVGMVGTAFFVLTFDTLPMHPARITCSVSYPPGGDLRIQTPYLCPAQSTVLPGYGGRHRLPGLRGMGLGQREGMGLGQREGPRTGGLQSGVLPI